MATVKLLRSSGNELPDGRHYEKVYRVRSTDSDPNFIMQTQDDGLPGFGQTWPSDPFSVVVDINPTEWKKVNDAGVTNFEWIVVIRYAPRTSNKVKLANPINEKPTVSIASVFRENALFKDLTGKPIENSAAVPYDPGLVELQIDDMLSVGVNLPNIGGGAFDMAATMAFKDTFNGSAITITDYDIPQYAGLMTDIDVVAASRNGTDYWAVTYHMQITRRSGLWRVEEVLDKGFYFIDTDGFLKQIKEEGEPVKDAQLLNGSGGRLAPGADAKFQSFSIKNDANWSALNLPSSTF